MNYANTQELPFIEAGTLKLHPFSGNQLMVVRALLPKGSIAPKHAHPHEQMSLIAKGKVKVRMEGKEIELSDGGIVHFPSNVEHELEAVEDSLLFDIFTPLREDFLEKLNQKK
jgi:quercetin dioxygenase-like cupin family protein